MEISGFILSYAESAYFTRYLYRNYGSEKIYELVNAYASGIDCELGFEQVIGTPLYQVEQKWIAESFGQTAHSGIDLQHSSLWPWLILLVIVITVPMMAAIPGLIRSRE
jgi:hypothetical protein